MKQKSLYCYCSLLLLWNLSASAQQPRLVAPIGHTSKINTVAFSPDGKKVVTGADDNTASIWDPVSGKLLAVLAGHKKEITRVSFSPNGLYILTSSNDETARLWEARTGKPLRSFETTGTDAVFSPDSKKIVTSGVLSSMLWDIETGENIFEFTGSTEPGTGFNIFSPDGKQLISLPDLNDEYTNDDNKAELFNTETGEPIQQLTGHKGVISVAAFSINGERIGTGSKDGSIIIWNGKTSKVLLRPEGHKFEITSLEFSPDGKYFLSASGDNTAKVWQTTTGKLLYTLKGHTNIVSSARFSRDGEYIVTVSGDNTARVWSATTGKLLVILRGHTRGVNTVDFSPVDHTVVTGSSDFTAKLWNIKTGKLISEMSGKNIESTMALFLPSDSMIFSATYPPEIWNRYRGKIQLKLRGFAKPNVNYITCSDDGKYLLTTTRISGSEDLEWDVEKAKLVRSAFDTAAIIWDAVTGKLLHCLKGHEESVKTAAFSHDGKKIVTGSWDNTAIIWDAATGKLLHQLKGHTQLVRSVSFSANDSLVATASWDKSVRIWDAATGKEQSVLRVWYDYAGGLNSASFSPDGRKVVTAAYGNEYAGHIWNIQDSTIVTDLLSDEGSVPLEEASSCSAVYSPDGKWILTNSPLSIWNAETGKQVSTNGYHKIRFASFSNDSKKVLSVSPDNTIQVWDMYGTDPETKPKITLSGHTGYIHSAFFSHNCKEIISTSEDGTLRLWDVKSGKLISIFFGIGKDDQFTLTGEGFYQTSPSAAKFLHYVNQDLKIINFDQLDVRYNRPDRVLEAIGNTDTALIKSYRKAWEKRIKKLGIDTTAFRDGYSVPDCDFVNRDAIDYEQKTGTLRLHIKGVDSTYQLDRFNVWVNESPLYGQRGIRIRKKNTNTLDTTITIQLSQ